MDLTKIKSNVVETSVGCWEWQKSCNSSGYGQLTESKSYWLAHRYAYACIKPLAKGVLVRHKCHNRKCCNPSHLEVGTHKDNWHDSKEVHLEASAKNRKEWVVAGVKYKTLRVASQQTGVHQATLLKHTKGGVFDVESYRLSCKKANVSPTI